MRLRKFKYARRRSHAGFKLAAISIAAMILLVLVDAKIRPIVKNMAAYQAQIYAVNAINDATAKELSDSGLKYSDIVTLNYNQAGTVTSIQTDIIKINQLKANVTNRIMAELGSMDGGGVRVPVGTLLGGQFLFGRGPRVTVRLVPIGVVLTDITNNFTGAGINQTRHQIMLNVTAKISAIIPGYSVTAEVKTNICIAETIIVGQVPGSFTEVTGDDRGTLDKLNDYRGSGSSN